MHLYYVDLGEMLSFTNIQDKSNQNTSE